MVHAQGCAEMNFWQVALNLFVLASSFGHPSLRTPVDVSKLANAFGQGLTRFKNRALAENLPFLLAVTWVYLR